MSELKKLEGRLGSAETERTGGGDDASVDIFLWYSYGFDTSLMKIWCFWCYSVFKLTSV